MKLRNLGVLGVASLLAVTAVVPALAQDKGTLKIGIDLPLSGGEAVNGQPTANGVLLAVQQANAAGGVQGYKLDTDVRDDVRAGAHDPNQGAENVRALVSDPSVVAMVGAFNSSVSYAEIPITNEAGLPQCSPSNTLVDLTGAGSEKYRPVHPDQRNYFRTATNDAIQGGGLAQYAFNDLGKRKAYVVDDTEAFGVGVANEFGKEFIRLGGEVVKRDGNDYKVNKDFSGLLTAAQGLGFDVVFFGGTQPTGGGQLRKQMGQAGMLDIPFVGPDGITDLQASDFQGSFINLAGIENSGNVFGSVAGKRTLPDPAAFETAYTAAFGSPPGAYSALAYACAQLIIHSLDKALAAGTSMDGLREAVRAGIFAGDTVDTVLGPLVVNPQGDSGYWLTLYKTDTTLNGGKGGWTLIREEDHTPVASPSASTAP